MRALFLDRDGVINIDHRYVASRERFEFMPAIFQLARAAKAKGFTLFVVANQAGIARGLFSEEDFAHLMQWVRGEFERHGAAIAEVYHCPRHPEFGPQHLRIRCGRRKPAPGLLLRAEREHGVDMGASGSVGDKETDMLAGLRAGVGSLIWVGGERPDPRWMIVASLADAASVLPEGGSES